MYDLKAIKAIPCSEIAKKYGMNLKQKHGRLWGKLRKEERTESFSINLEKNLWYDFGAGKGGSVIDLVAELEGVTPKDAINILARDYGFETEKTTGWMPLTDNQYKEIGIQPERATLNFKFDLNKHSIEQLERWSNKYGMPVKDLAIKYPDIYNKMVVKIATENINALRENYYAKLKLYSEPTRSALDKKFLKETASEIAIQINNKVDLLQRAVTTGAAAYLYLKVAHEKDFSLSNVSKEVTNTIKNTKDLSQDEKIRDKIINVYKKLFNYKQADFFTVKHAVAIQEINKIFSNSNNKYLSVQGIKDLYNKLGQKLDKLEDQYCNAIKHGSPDIENIAKNIAATKEVFNKCSVAVEGIREANLIYKQEIEKQKSGERVQIKSNELVQ